MIRSTPLIRRVNQHLKPSICDQKSDETLKLLAFNDADRATDLRDEAELEGVV